MSLDPGILEIQVEETLEVKQVVSSDVIEVVGRGPQGLQGPAGSGGLIFGVPIGAIDGVNVNFTVSQNFTDIAVYLNGLRLVGSGNDYTVTGLNSFTMTNPPLTGDILAVEYTTA